jgi:hypothetical protein
MPVASSAAPSLPILQGRGRSSSDPREGARPEHPYTATGLNNLAGLLQDQGDLAGCKRRV